jgi:hypothetical protein
MLAPSAASAAQDDLINPLLAGVPSHGTGPDVEGDDARASGRARLSALSPRLHCSVIGTCLTTAGLRKVAEKMLMLVALNMVECIAEVAPRRAK